MKAPGLGQRLAADRGGRRNGPPGIKLREAPPFSWAAGAAGAGGVSFAAFSLDSTPLDSTPLDNRNSR